MIIRMEYGFVGVGIIIGMIVWHFMSKQRNNGLSDFKKELEQQRADNLNDFKKELENSIKAMAADALHQNSEQFSQKTELQLKPLGEQIKSLDKATQKLERDRSEESGRIFEQLSELKNTTKDLSSASISLTTALRGSSQARGNWGESLLENIVELAGMKEGIHYEVQKRIDNKLTPDMQVFLPGGQGVIPIDSKVSLSAFMDAQEAEDLQEKKKCLQSHTNSIKKHIKDLAHKDYASAIEGDVDFTVMFLPGDHLLEATFEFDPHLQENAMSKRILIVTPVTLLALLRTVHLYWKQELLAKNAEKIADIAREYHSRVNKFVDHVAKIGTQLESGIKSYNNAIGSYNSRIKPQGNKLEELGVNEAGKTLPDIDEIEAQTKQLSS